MVWTNARQILTVLGILGVFVGGSFAQTLPRCSDRPTTTVNDSRIQIGFCLERAYTTSEHGDFGLTALASAPDGTLYATRPLYGQVLALTDTDNDGLVDQEQVILADLELPNALYWHDNALYIGTMGAIYRYQAGILSLIVADLPSDSLFWVSALTVYDNRLYVGISVPCEACAFDPERYGVVVSFALDGTQQQIVARGLYYPRALGQLGQALVVSDVASYRTEGGQDALYLVQEGADYRTDSPLMRFVPQSHLVAVLPYTSPTLPIVAGSSLLVLGGQINQFPASGFEVTAVGNTTTLDPTTFDYQPILPYDGQILRGKPYYNENGYINLQSRALSEFGLTFYPHPIYGAAVTREGWIYLSVSGGVLYAVRNP